MDGAQILGTLMTPEGRADPYPLYEAGHQIGPIVPVEEGFVLVLGYDEVNQLLRGNTFGVNDPKVREVWDPAWRDRPAVKALESSILNANAPEHGRMRSLISSVFTPRRVAGLEPAVAAATERLLDSMADQGSAGRPVDFMDEFAYRLPVSVICELLGVPEAERDRFRVLATELAAVLDFNNESDLDGADFAAIALEELFIDLVAERRARPQDDLVSALIAACDADDGKLSETELLSNMALLLIAGFETTANLFGNGVRLLFDHPEIAAGLRAGTVPYTGFVEETLRFDSPVQLTSRTAVADGLKLGPVELGKGWEIAVMIGAANRDPNRYADPGRFDPTRTDINPLSFGAGAHFCVGSVLARLEAATAFPRLLDRFPDLAPGGEPVRNSRLVLRGFQHLPVTVTT